MTLTEIENYVLNFLQTDFTNGNWTQAEVDQYIRDCELAIAAMVAEKHEDFFKTTALLSEVAGTSIINLPTNCFRVLKVERVIGYGASTAIPIPLTKIDRNTNAEQMALGGPFWQGTAGVGTTTYPGYYEQHGQKQIELFPAPAGSSTNSLRVTYIYRPAKMTLGTHVPFQEIAGTGGSGTDNLEEFHDILGKYATEQCLYKEGSAEAVAQGDRINRERMKREQQLMQFLGQMNVQTPKMIRQTESCWDG